PKRRLLWKARTYQDKFQVVAIRLREPFELTQMRHPSFERDSRPHTQSVGPVRGIDEQHRALAVLYQHALCGFGGFTRKRFDGGGGGLIYGLAHISSSQPLFSCCLVS